MEPARNGTPRPGSTSGAGQVHQTFWRRLPTIAARPRRWAIPHLCGSFGWQAWRRLPAGHVLHSPGMPRGADSGATLSTCRGGDLSQGSDVCGVPAPLAPNRGEEREDDGIAGWVAHRRLRRIGPTVGRRDHRAASGSSRSPQPAPRGGWRAAPRGAGFGRLLDHTRLCMLDARTPCFVFRPWSGR